MRLSVLLCIALIARLTVGGATPDPVTAPVSTGMWMPQQMVSRDVLALLRQDGLKLSKKDIYAINRRCAAGAALSLSVDNGLASPYASASFVSADGLVLTNFHCVNSYVQRLAKGDNDYLRYGCWASRREEEAPLFNLQVHQLLSVTDITSQVLAAPTPWTRPTATPLPRSAHGPWRAAATSLTG